MLGPVALGFYVLAFNLSNWPVTVFSQPVREVSPAAFARLQSDPPALRSAFVSSVGLLAAVTLPVCLVLTRRGGADHLRRLRRRLDARGRGPRRGSGFFAGLRILFELFYDYFVVLGSTRVVFTVQVIWFVALVPALYAGAKLGGIAGAAFAHVVGGGRGRRSRSTCSSCSAPGSRGSRSPRASPCRWPAAPAWRSSRWPPRG